MILDHIDSPADLKRLSTSELSQLCAEVRETIIGVVAENGGHLAPSLGTVELAVALHHVFDSPSDKIVWDVGHQAYAHKILTGRREAFSTLRQMDGMSGFPRSDESRHDVFCTGHGSTSISAALGMAHAMSRRGDEGRAIAVIGDGSMTGGLAFEGLNHAGHRAGNLIVILNDNEMSISPSVGALARFLTSRIHGGRANRIREKLKNLILAIPWFGERIFKCAQRAEEATVSLLTPGFLFEAFGFDYIGPLDGHDLAALIDVFRDVKTSSISMKPMLVHVLTSKGKGYAPAEQNPTRFHGVGPFDRQTGQVRASKGRTFTDAFGDAIVDAASADGRIMAITAAMVDGTGLGKFARSHPERFFDVGMAEGHAVTFAAGLASQRYRPVVAIYSTFLQRAYDNILHDVCLQNLPVVFALDRAGLVGDDGPTHHGVFDLSYLRSMPNMTVCAPRNEGILRDMLAAAFVADGPTAIRYPRGALPDDCCAMRGRTGSVSAELVFGNDHPSAVVWAVGHLVDEAVAAARRLRTEGIDVAVVDPRYIKPFDETLLLEYARRCMAVVTVEENVVTGGFGSMIGEIIHRENISGLSLLSLGIPDRFVEHGPQNMLRARCGIDASGIAAAVRHALEADDDEPADIATLQMVNEFNTHVRQPI